MHENLRCNGAKERKSMRVRAMQPVKTETREMNLRGVRENWKYGRNIRVLAVLTKHHKRIAEKKATWNRRVMTEYQWRLQSCGQLGG